jgi:hypothetical protein
MLATELGRTFDAINWHRAVGPERGRRCRVDHQRAIQGVARQMELAMNDVQLWWTETF